jgi:hypothetical protein
MDFLLDADTTAFVQSGVSVTVASCSAAQVPSLAKALACIVSDDRRRISVVLMRHKAEALLADLHDTGALALVCSAPSSHRTLQLKGRFECVEPAGAAQIEHTLRCLHAFSAELVGLGLSPAFVATFSGFRADDACVIRFRPQAAFIQTPGPQAGKPL